MVHRVHGLVAGTDHGLGYWDLTTGNRAFKQDFKKTFLDRLENEGFPDT